MKQDAPNCCQNNISPNIFEIYERIRNNAIGNTCDSRKDAKHVLSDVEGHVKFGETGKYFFFALLAAWREKIS
jgi:hypothetical protein